MGFFNSKQMVFSYAVQLSQCLGLNHANILGMCAAFRTSS